MINNSVLRYLPKKVEKILLEELHDEFDNIEEIRLRAERPIIIKLNSEDRIVKYKVTSEDLLNALQYICENSIYSYQHEISSRIYNNKRRT